MKCFAVMTAGAVLAMTPALLASAAEGDSAQSQASDLLPNITTDESAHAVLAESLAALIRHAIPPVTEKQEDWGATKEVAVGLQIEGKPFHRRFHRRTKAVDHGVWKQYTVRVIEPEKNLVVQMTQLRALPEGRMGFTLHLEAPLDVWARAKVYQYGVHLIALEMEGDTRLKLDIDGQVGVRFHAGDGAAIVAVVPVVTDARLSLEEFHIRRVSDAKGPLVRQLSDGVRRVIEDEFNGPQLTAKLNRAIDKKRDRLVFSSAKLMSDSWWPLTPVSPVETAP